MKLYSGYFEVWPGKTVFLPCPMTMMEIRRWRFGPLAALLVGTAAVPAGAGVFGLPAVAAGTGLIGTGGAITAGGLGLLGMVGGQVMGGMAAKKQAENEAAIADYNAGVAKQEARQIEARTVLAQRRSQQEGERILGSLAAELGASGAVTTVGAPLLMKAKQRTELELDTLMVGYEGQVAASRARSQAKLYGVESSAATQRGRSALTAGIIGAAGTTLLGFSQLKKPKPYGALA